jgi:hypothetical protein
MERTMPRETKEGAPMIRKLAICAAVALVPTIAFAAGASTNPPASTDTHVVGADTKTAATVKSEAVKSDSTVKAEAAVKPQKAVTHRVTHKAKTKADSKSDSKVDSTKLQ